MRKRLFDSVVMALCLLLYAYFGWHYFYGPRSAAVQAELASRQAELRERLKLELEKRLQLEAKVELLRPEHVDLDFLDETARQLLNYVDDRELIITK
jgi:cell division protein FtsB